MGNKLTDRTRRRELRKRLEKRGVDPDEIVRQVEELRARQRLRATPAYTTPDSEARRARRRANRPARDRGVDPRVEEETYARLSLDDSGYRPPKRDSLTVGAGRATGQTAKAVRRGTTITKWQHDENEAR